MQPEITPPLAALNLGNLIDSLNSSDWRVQTAAQQALEQLGAACVPALVAGMAHPAWRVRRSCALLLDHLADDNCLPALTAALDDPVANVRRNAVHTLMCGRCKPRPFSGDVIPLLIRAAVTDRSRRVRRIAVQALAEHAMDPRAAAALRTLIDDPDAAVRARAVRGLSQLEGCDSPHPDPAQHLPSTD